MNYTKRISVLTKCMTLMLTVVAFQLSAAKAPLSLHPDNPHYFLFRGKPTALITSGEHYGAVLNLDFDYRKYLDTLAQDGLNNTRTFSGAYCESPGDFNIASNTLAPLPGRFICPWARSPTPGYANGGNKFDLNQWDEKYFARLKDFVRYAGRRGVVVEINLFCPFYSDSMWKLSPMNAVNNVNHVGAVARTNVYTLDAHGGLLAVQEAMVHKFVTELKDFDNIYYEICNEPYFGGVTLEWQGRIADVITDTERQLGVRHLISQNIANGRATVQHPHPAVSIFNFHYATPPDTVDLNHGLNKVIGDNETGFKGTNDTHYRMEAWQFILAGGGLYNNLDYSFVAGREDGTFVYPVKQPGGGNPVFRRQMRTLTRFIQGFDFIRMKPDRSIFKGGLPEKAKAYALVETGKQYAVYLFGGSPANLEVELPAGNYQAEWLDPVTGKVGPKTRLKHTGGAALLKSPSYAPDVVLRIVRR
ncbi:MAG TPA: cellulase family glycosylhydrolase [Verrucomicrobiae bacterium]|nr:cellulase family glycosylhydrolase [Verrucomicrobiae bacterium]